jgi:hypothetical protein
MNPILKPPKCCIKIKILKRETIQVITGIKHFSKLMGSINRRSRFRKIEKTLCRTSIFLNIPESSEFLLSGADALSSDWGAKF